MELPKTINIAIEYLGKEIFSDLQLSFFEEGDNDFLRVKRENDDVYIYYGCLSNLFYFVA